jgi:ribosomal-protein-alanine N-acetyltransferase
VGRVPAAAAYNLRMIPVLETLRLWLRPVELADAEQTQALFPNWEIVKLLAAQVPWPYPRDAAFTYIRDMALPLMERGEEWHWTLRLKTEAERLVGFVSLRRLPWHNRGFWIAPPWQGQGLMSEASAAVTDYWFDVLGEPVMRISKAAANLGSRKISERQGMRMVATCESEYVSGTLLTEQWEITAEEWRARRAPSR